VKKQCAKLLRDDKYGEKFADKGLEMKLSGRAFA
jgi:hypothetical protein